MKCCQDDLKRGFILEFGVWVDRDATTIISNGYGAVELDFNFDPTGVACDRFVHGIIEDFGDEMMERFLIGATDIHARTLANGLEAL